MSSKTDTVTDALAEKQDPGTKKNRTGVVKRATAEDDDNKKKNKGSNEKERRKTKEEHLKVWMEKTEDEGEEEEEDHNGEDNKLDKTKTEKKGNAAANFNKRKVEETDVPNAKPNQAASGPSLQIEQRLQLSFPLGLRATATVHSEMVQDMHAQFKLLTRFPQKQGAHTKKDRRSVAATGEKNDEEKKKDNGEDERRQTKEDQYMVATEKSTLEEQNEKNQQNKESNKSANEKRATAISKEKTSDNGSSATSSLTDVVGNEVDRRLKIGFPFGLRPRNTVYSKQIRSFEDEWKAVYPVDYPLKEGVAKGQANGSDRKDTTKNSGKISKKEKAKERQTLEEETVKRCKEEDDSSKKLQATNIAVTTPSCETANGSSLEIDQRLQLGFPFGLRATATVHSEMVRDMHAQFKLSMHFPEKQGTHTKRDRKSVVATGQESDEEEKKDNGEDERRQAKEDQDKVATEKSEWEEQGEQNQQDKTENEKRERTISKKKTADDGSSATPSLADVVGNEVDRRLRMGFPFGLRPRNTVYSKKIRSFEDEWKTVFPVKYPLQKGVAKGQANGDDRKNTRKNWGKISEEKEAEEKQTLGEENVKRCDEKDNITEELQATDMAVTTPSCETATGLRIDEKQRAGFLFGLRATATSYPVTTRDMHARSKLIRRFPKKQEADTEKHRRRATKQTTTATDGKAEEKEDDIKKKRGETRGDQKEAVVKERKNKREEKGEEEEETQRDNQNKSDKTKTENGEKATTNSIKNTGADESKAMLNFTDVVDSEVHRRPTLDFPFGLKVKSTVYSKRIRSFGVEWQTLPAPGCLVEYSKKERNAEEQTNEEGGGDNRIKKVPREKETAREKSKPEKDDVKECDEEEDNLNKTQVMDMPVASPNYEADTVLKPDRRDRSDFLFRLTTTNTKDSNFTPSPDDETSIKGNLQCCAALELEDSKQRETSKEKDDRKYTEYKEERVIKKETDREEAGTKDTKDRGEQKENSLVKTENDETNDNNSAGEQNYCRMEVTARTEATRPAMARFTDTAIIQAKPELADQRDEVNDTSHEELERSTTRTRTGERRRPKSFVQRAVSRLARLLMPCLFRTRTED